MKITALNEQDTASAAQKLAAKLRPGDVICLEGDLGAGKTVFARALIRALTGNPDEDVPSPTFTLAQIYDTARGPLWHFDLYRIEDSQEIYELGWEEALSGGIVLVEWPQHLEALAPPERLTVKFTVLKEPNQREITFIPHGRWAERLD